MRRAANAHKDITRKQGLLNYFSAIAPLTYGRIEWKKRGYVLAFQSRKNHFFVFREGLNGKPGSILETGSQVRNHSYLVRSGHRARLRHSESHLDLCHTSTCIWSA